eukprot:CAMPEP_0114607278 /NCGR_PEP_ID=MMETSP0168-20121206/1987_1 /TAXON_ID=95228 ORGANISM="Vannella sp., Strain DIVA3 517/6/12" /NCGR_SAMPLE_ID=MMETSP0168 /ASSEMBLY_ACC=CAM_ASM_000044 /LENGTH=390 /DNA_ID=CAMNT_0001818153 /DNA_START=1 /DNA_END=1171 /DNA_ORIENTATION=-
MGARVRTSVGAGRVMRWPQARSMSACVDPNKPNAALLQRLANEHGLKTTSDWKKLSTRDVYKAGGSGALKRHGFSIFSLLEEGLHPGPSGKLWPHDCRKTMPHRYWKQPENARAFLQSITAEVAPTTLHEWAAALTRKKLIDAGGAGLLREHGGTVRSLLAAVMPELGSQGPPERSARKPPGYWAKKENQREFLEYVGRVLKIEDVQEWTGEEEVLELGGAGLLSQFEWSLAKALKHFYPELKVRTRKENGHWKNKAACRAFMEEVASEHGVKEARDWQKVTTADVVAMGGSSLLTEYGWSMATLLKEVVFGGQVLDLSDVRPVLPNGYWSSVENRKRFLERFAAERGLHSPADWQSISSADVEEEGGRGLLSGRSLLSELRAAFGEEYS